jgi:surfeit locus 1 family protein
MLVLHALATVATVAAVLLGLWQYGAWQHGREHQAEARVDDAPVPLASVMTADQAFPAEGLGRPVSLSGRWVSSGTVYVTGKVLHGREGVWVVTPVEVCPAPDGPAGCDRAPAMLVVRGWAPSVERAPRPPSGPVEVTGWLQPGEGPGAGTGPAGQPAGRSSDDPGDDVLGGLRIAEAVQHVDQDLYGGFVIAEEVSGAGGQGGLQPVTPAALPEPDTFTSVRNLLYALEWWVFGGFAVFMWWRWCRDEVSRVTGVPSTA